MERTYCSDCGAEVTPGDNYCAECGASLAARGERTGARTGSRAGPDRPETEGDRTFAAITHILGFLTWVIGPLLVLVATDDEFVKENARNALNWQLMVAVYMLVSFVLLFVLVGLVFVFIVPLVNVAFCVIAAIKATEGEAWRYPLTPNIV